MTVYYYYVCACAVHVIMYCVCVCVYVIRELVDSLCRDDTDVEYINFLIASKLSNAWILRPFRLLTMILEWLFIHKVSQPH